MPRERTHYFIKFLILFWLLYLSECFFLLWNKICFPYYQVVQILFSQQIYFQLSPTVTTYFKIVILSSSLISRVKKKILDSFNSRSWDMGFTCFTLAQSSLNVFCLSNSPLKTYHQNRKQSGGKCDTQRITNFCDLSVVFLSYNVADKIGSFQVVT